MTDEKLPDESRNRMSRRTVLKLTGAGAAIAWTTPIISSVRMPAFAASGCTDIVFQDDFEGETPPCGVPEPSLTKWDILAGSVDLVGGPTCGNGFFQLGTLSSTAVDLDGTPAGGATIRTKASFPAGTYQLTFDLAGSLRNGGDATDTVMVDFGGPVDTIVVANPVPMTPHSYSVVLAGTAQLQFQNLGSDLRGALLDNVVITQCS